MTRHELPESPSSTTLGGDGVLTPAYRGLGDTALTLGLGLGGTFMCVIKLRTGDRDVEPLLNR